MSDDVPIRRMTVPEGKHATRPWRSNYRRYPRYYGRGNMAEDGGWQKSINLQPSMSLTWLGKLIVAGGILFGVAYILFPTVKSAVSNWLCKLSGQTNCDETAAVCPAGYHSVDRCAGLTGLPLVGCQAGMFVTGNTFGCAKDTDDFTSLTCECQGIPGVTYHPLASEYPTCNDFCWSNFQQYSHDTGTPPGIYVPTCADMGWLAALDPRCWFGWEMA